MTNDQLKQLFIQYLNREPNRDEYRIHLKKDYAAFALEISECEERMRVSGTLPKIALLASGHIRNKNLFASLPGLSKKYEIDVFAFTWDNVGLKGKETDIEDRCDPEGIEKYLTQNVVGLRKYKIENNKEFILANSKTDVKYFNYSSPEVFIKSQLYAIKKSYELFEEYCKDTGKTYPIVIKARADSEFTLFAPDEVLTKEVNNNKIIFVPNYDCGHAHPDYGTACWACNNMYKQKFRRVHIFEHTNIICDLFAYGSAESMKKYCSMLDVYDTMNREFEEKNFESIAHGDIKYKMVDGVHVLNGSEHAHSTYYLNCSYPERLIQRYLTDYMLVESSKIKMRFRR